MSHDLTSPSAWVVRFARLIPTGSRVLDVACGSGRHTRYLAELGHNVVAVDRDPAPELGRLSGVEVLQYDLETAAYPFTGQVFSAIVVTNYLHRPLLPLLLASLDGVLIYETFARGNEKFGKPSNPDFLLERGELLEFVRGCLTVIAYEDLTVDEPRPAAIQRICAVKPDLGPKTQD
ncbi:MAG: class I SAM-dependent methyltransferase [Burkholderiales bacterium]